MILYTIIPPPGYRHDPLHFRPDAVLKIEATNITPIEYVFYHTAQNRVHIEGFVREVVSGTYRWKSKVGQLVSVTGIQDGLTISMQPNDINWI